MSRHHRDTATRDRDRAAIARTKSNCHICGKPIDYTLKYPDPQCFVVDHVIPLDRGGPDTRANKRAAHNTCNRAKHARLIAPIVKRSGSLA